jgi:hypothetical protein
MLKKIILVIIAIILVIWWLAGLTKHWYIDNYLWISFLETASETNNDSKEIIEEKINSWNAIVQVEKGKIKEDNNLLNQVSELKKGQLEDTFKNERNNTMADIIREKDQWNKKEYVILDNRIIPSVKSNTGMELAWEEDNNTNLETNEEYADVEKPNYRTPIFVHEDLQDNYNEPDHYDSTISVYEEFLDREYTSNLGDDVLIRVDLDSFDNKSVEEFELKDMTWINIFNTEKNIKGSEAITGLWILR